MLGVAAQRIAWLIRKPRNNADECHCAETRRDGAFRAICIVAHLIPESLRRGHAGLIQRFPKLIPHSRLRGSARGAAERSREPRTLDTPLACAASSRACVGALAGAAERSREPRTLGTPLAGAAPCSRSHAGVTCSAAFLTVAA